MNASGIATIAFLAAAVTGLGESAHAQSVQSYRGATVMDAGGRLVAPWKEVRSCRQPEAKCRTLIFNPETREIASVDGKWATKFETTGVGKQVRRAETSIAKAGRLKGMAPAAN